MLFLTVCSELAPFIRIVQKGIIPIIEIAIPIILIVLGMFDLGKAVVASKEDEIKAAQKLLIKRVIYAVAIFFVTFLVITIFNIIVGTQKGGTMDDTEQWKTCWNDVRDGKY